MCVHPESLQSCLTLWDSGLQPAKLLCPWDCPGKNPGVGCHALLQGIFLIHGLNPGTLHCMWILYLWVTGETPIIFCIIYHFSSPHLPLLIYFSYLSVLVTSHWLLVIRNSLKINSTSELISSHMSHLSSSDLNRFQTLWFLSVHLCHSNWNYTGNCL